jgi:hypothetical protein
VIRERTNIEVLSSAAQIDDAIAAGLSVEQMVALVAARHAWRILGQLDPTTMSDELLTGLALPAAVEWDAIFVRRARQELGLVEARMPAP